MLYLCFTGVAVVLFLVLFNLSRQKPPAKAAAAKKDYTPVYITLADKPDQIMRGMDNLVAQSQKVETAGQRWWWAPLVIFVFGAGLIAVDGLLTLFGYSSFVFSAGGILLWIAAFVMAFALRRSRAQAFSPRYAGTKTMLYTLRDDLRPDTTFLGHLDLTGALLPSKVAHETNDAQKRTTQYFRDEWLALKAKLYDGNILRLSAIQRTKQRKSYWKRSRISGKMKMKPAKLKGAEQQLKVRIAVNPEVYQITRNKDFNQGQNIGKYRIDQLDTEGGIINVVASAPSTDVETDNILTFLQSTYSLLQRKAA